jgi:hypothetical protein
MANLEGPEVLVATSILVVLATLEVEKNSLVSRRRPRALPGDPSKVLEEPCMGETLQHKDSI